MDRWWSWYIRKETEIIHIINLFYNLWPNCTVSQKGGRTLPAALGRKVKMSEPGIKLSDIIPSIMGAIGCERRRLVLEKGDNSQEQDWVGLHPNQPVGDTGQSLIHVNRIVGNWIIPQSVFLRKWVFPTGKWSLQTWCSRVFQARMYLTSNHLCSVWSTHKYGACELWGDRVVAFTVCTYTKDYTNNWTYICTFYIHMYGKCQGCNRTGAELPTPQVQ